MMSEQISLRLTAIVFVEVIALLDFIVSIF